MMKIRVALNNQAEQGYRSKSVWMTTEHSAASYGLPVLTGVERWDSDKAHGPSDLEPGTVVVVGTDDERALLEAAGFTAKVVTEVDIHKAALQGYNDRNR